MEAFTAAIPDGRNSKTDGMTFRAQASARKRTKPTPLRRLLEKGQLSPSESPRHHDSCVDPIIGIIDNLHRTMRSQAECVYECLALRPSLPESFHQVADTIVSQLVSDIDRSRDTLCRAASSSCEAALGLEHAKHNDKFQSRFCSPISANASPGSPLLLRNANQHSDQCLGSLEGKVAEEEMDTAAPLGNGSSSAVHYGVNCHDIDILAAAETNKASKSHSFRLTHSSDRFEVEEAEEMDAFSTVFSPAATCVPTMSSQCEGGRISLPQKYGRMASIDSGDPTEALGLVDEIYEKIDPSASGKCVDGVMNPNWHGRLGWDLGVILLVAIDSMVVPFQMAYKESGPPDAFDQTWLWLTTNFFALDMIASFLTGYTAGKDEPGIAPGKLVTTKSRITRHYFKTWFAIDFASTIPWAKIAESLSSDTGGGSSSRSAQMAKLTKVVKFVRFLRLMRMLRLAKLAVIWERVEASMGSLILKQSCALLRVIFVLIGICHWNACIWWIVGQETNLITELMSKEARETYKELPHWTSSIRALRNSDKTWIDMDTPSQYIFCFYWTLGVMRTMPSEVTPQNNAERLYIMFFMFFAFSAFAVCIALITQTFFKFSERKRNFEEDMSAVRMYLRSIKADQNVQTSVKEFLKHLFERRKIQAREVGMLHLMPTQLSGMLKYCKLKPFLAKLAILEGLPPKAAFCVSDIVEVNDIGPGTFLCHKGKRPDAAFVLIAGRLSVKHLDEDNMDELDVVDDQCLFDEDYVSPETVVSCACSEIMRVDKEKFYNLLMTCDTFKTSWTFKDLHANIIPLSPHSTATIRNKEAIAVSATVVAS